MKNSLSQTSYDYLRISDKYKSYLKRIVHTKPPRQMTVLSGKAGAGKSEVLKNEFIKPISETDSHAISFSFVPDNELHNHNFWDNLIDKTIKIISQKRTKDAVVISNKLLSHRINSIKKPFNYNENLRVLTEALNFLAHDRRIFLFFEDIHFCTKSFKDFLGILADNDSSNIHIVCTTRDTRYPKSVSSNITQKWIYIEDLNIRNIGSYIEFLNKRYESSDISIESILALTGGNPFLVNQIYLLNKRRKEGLEDNKLITINHSDPYAGKLTIVNLRYSYLSIEEKNILSALSILGFSNNQHAAKSFLKYININNSEKHLSNLIEEGFLRVIRNDNLEFTHHILYEAIKSITSVDQKFTINKAAFSYFRRSIEKERYDKLADYAFEAGMYAHAAYLSKIVANNMHENSIYDLACVYYERYIESLKKSSSPNKLLNRIVEPLTNLHSACLILGKDDKAESIASYLANISEEVSLQRKHHIYSTLTTSYWTNGNIIEARSYAGRNIKIAEELNVKEYIISSTARYGTLSMNAGFFETAIECHKKVKGLIQKEETNKKFGMFVEAYPCSLSVLSNCFFETGEIIQAREKAHNAYDHFNKTKDTFTKLFIAVYAGYTATMQGDFETCLPFLEEGIRASHTNNTTLLVPAAYSLAGVCNMWMGDKDRGQSHIRSAQDLMKKTYQGSKKGIIDYMYAESLLISYDVDNFSKLIDTFISDAQGMKQFSYVAWLYYLKAVYHAFYKHSSKGFIGSYVKSSAIAQNLGMKTLLENLTSLANLESTQILKADQRLSQPQGFFDKSAYFHSITNNIKPISFHIKH